MNNIKLSIIIPIYNCEKYIKDCIDSIVNQNLDSFELILVNDCSNDRSWKICKSYSKIDNVRYIEHKMNKGPGIARNTGVNIARGQYVFFMDGDDLLEPETLAMIFDKIAVDNVDYIFLNHKIISEDGTVLNNKPRTNYYGQEVKEFFDQVIGCTHRFPVWRFVINRNCISKFDLKFSEAYIQEDVILTWKLIIQTKRVTFINSEVYCYRKNNNSLTEEVGRNPEYDADRIIHSVVDGAEFYQKIIQDTEKQERSRKYFRTVALKYLQTAICVDGRISVNLEEERIAILENMLGEVCEKQDDLFSLISHFGIEKGISIFKNTFMSSILEAQRQKRKVYLAPYDSKQFTLINMLQLNGVQVDGIIDNNQRCDSKWAIPIFTLEKVLRKKRCSEIFIIICHIKCNIIESIEKQLVANNLKEGTDYIVVR